MSLQVGLAAPDLANGGWNKCVGGGLLTVGWHERFSMALLMLRCPMTDRNFSTGINTDSERLRLIPDTRIAAHCPYCGQEHPWGPRDAFLAESIPLGEQIAVSR